MRRKFRKVLSILASLALSFELIVSSFSPALVYAAPSDLDPTFGDGGKVTTDFGGSNDLAFALEVQPDGKLVTVGQSVGGTPTVTSDFSLARYNQDGELDPTFGSGGKVVLNVGGHGAARDVSIQQDGKIVVVGYARFYSAPASRYIDRIILIRLNPNGNPDVNFGDDGIIITGFDPLKGISASALVIQQDGKIVVAGSTGIPNHAAFALVRYRSDGSLDTDFGNGGISITKFEYGPSGRDWSIATSLAIQTDRKLVAAGLAGVNDSGDFALARYNSDGSLDQTFGSEGKVTTTFNWGSYEVAHSLILQPNDKLVAGGYTSSPAQPTQSFAVARYNSNGSLDNNFGIEGKTITDFSGVPSFIYGLDLQPNGKILAAGEAGPWPNYGFALVRYNSNGDLDLNFGIEGRSLIDFSASNDGARSIVLLPNGKILLAGHANSYPSDFALARYEGGESNVAPTANAGLDQTVLVNEQVFLDGSGSLDPNNDPLTYLWNEDPSNPQTGLLSNPTSASPSFTPTVAGIYTFSLVVNDSTVDSSPDTVVVTVQTPAQAIPDLIDLVETFNLQQGITNSLDAKLDATINALVDLNENNDVAALNSLYALINAVEAQRDNKITNEQADELISAAQEIINSLTY